MTQSGSWRRAPGIAPAAAFMVGCLTLPATAYGQLRQLSVSPQPTVAIGREGDPSYEFTRVLYALETPSGHLVVVDQRANELRVFARDGRFERALGRGGAGPGEFRRIHSVLAAGDTLIIWDGTLRRLTRYLASGALVSTSPVTVRDPDRRFDIIGRMPDGQWLVHTAIQPMIERTPGPYRDSIHFGVLHADSLRWLATYPGPMLFVFNPVRTASRGLAVGGAAFAAWTQARVLGDRILVFDGTQPYVDVLTSTGTRAGRIPVPLDAERVTSAHAGDALAEERQRSPAPSMALQFAEAKYAEEALPKFAPRYDAIVTGIADEFWLQRYPLNRAAPTRFVGLRLNGASVGEFSLPPLARLLHVGRDFIWSAAVNDDGVETLERRSLVR